MASKTYIGIDPGAKGYMCLHDADGYRWAAMADTDEVLFMLRRIQGESMACVENVHAMPRQGLSSTFKFGVSLGMALGMLAACGVPYTLVPPTKWQREMWIAGDRDGCAGRKGNKRASYNAARRLHPGVDFRRSGRCRTFDDNMCDATLLCDYAMRRNL